LACGEIGLKVNYFYSLTPRQFFNIQAGYFKKQERLLENDWLQTKVLSYFVFSSIPKKKAKQKSFPDFVEAFFETKQEYKPERLDENPEERRERLRAFFNKVDKKRDVEQSG
tara:strand:- start:10735 stop:11070 length:336 start_codon:yes stop_codon:yes gene_type:complete